MSLSNPSNREVARWFSLLSSGLASGLTAQQVLKTARSIPPEDQNNMIAGIESGLTWKDFLPVNSKWLRSDEREIIVAAGESGKLPETLKRLSARRNTFAKVQGKALMAALYPLCVFHLGAVALPLVDLINNGITAYFLKVGMLLLPFWFLVFLFKFITSYSQSARAKVFRAIPLLRGYHIESEWAGMCFLVESGLAAGMPLERCLKNSLKITTDPILVRFTFESQKAVEEGKPMSSIFSRWQGILSIEYEQWIQAGEKSGTLEENYGILANKYSENASKKLTKAGFMYPILMYIAVAGYVTYKIFEFYLGYFKQIEELI